MKKTLLLCLVSTLMAFSITSCGTAQGALNDLRSLNYELKENRSRFSVADFEQARHRLDRIQERIRKYDYTKAEHEEIGRLTTSCYVYMGKNVAGTVVDDVSNAAHQVRGAIEGVRSAVEEIRKDNRQK